MKIEIPKHVIAELEYLIEMYKETGKKEWTTVEEIAQYVLDCIAEGSRRPGSWERGLLESMGLVADCPRHEAYRQQHGNPKDWELRKGEEIENDYREDMDLWLITIKRDRADFMPTGDIKNVEKPKQ